MIFKVFHWGKSMIPRQSWIRIFFMKNQLLNIFYYFPLDNTKLENIEFLWKHEYLVIILKSRARIHSLHSEWIRLFFLGVRWTSTVLTWGLIHCTKGERPVPGPWSKCFNSLWWRGVGEGVLLKFSFLRLG